jgi:hypothetical protein
VSKNITDRLEKIVPEARWEKAIIDEAKGEITRLLAELATLTASRDGWRADAEAMAWRARDGMLIPQPRAQTKRLVQAHKLPDWGEWNKHHAQVEAARAAESSPAPYYARQEPAR